MTLYKDALLAVAKSRLFYINGLIRDFRNELPKAELVYYKEKRKETSSLVSRIIQSSWNDIDSVSLTNEFKTFEIKSLANALDINNELNKEKFNRYRHLNPKYTGEYQATTEPEKLDCIY